MTKPSYADLFSGALAGLAGGLAASFAVKQFETLWSAIAPCSDRDEEEPPNVKVAEMVAHAASGHTLSNSAKASGGAAVHYSLGAALGIAYGVAAELRPQVTAGFGTAFGVVTALALEETLVPAAGIADPPGRVPLGKHVYGMTSHLVFGLVTEGTRSMTRRRHHANPAQIAAKLRIFAAGARGSERRR